MTIHISTEARVISMDELKQGNLPLGAIICLHIARSPDYILAAVDPDGRILRDQKGRYQQIIARDSGINLGPFGSNVLTPVDTAPQFFHEGETITCTLPQDVTIQFSYTEGKGALINSKKPQTSTKEIERHLYNLNK